MKNTIVVTVLAAVMLAISTKGFADTYSGSVKDDLLIAYASYYIIKECNANAPNVTGTYDGDVEYAKTLTKQIEIRLVAQNDLDTDAIWNEVVNDPDIQSFVSMLKLIPLSASLGGSTASVPICIDEYGPNLIEIGKAIGLYAKTNAKDF